MNKRANFIIIMTIAISIVALMIVGVIIAVGGSIISYGADVIVPEVNDLGMIGDANMTEIADYSINPLNTVVQSVMWFSGLMYVFGFIALFILAFVFRSTGSQWTIPFFLVLVILLLFTSIVISNMYEDIYESGDFLGEKLAEQKMLSFLLLYSPLVILFFSIAIGFVMFSGASQEGGLV